MMKISPFLLLVVIASGVTALPACAQASDKEILVAVAETPGMAASVDPDIAAIVRPYGVSRDIIILSPRHANNAGVLQVALAFVRSRRDPAYKGPDRLTIRASLVGSKVKGSSTDLEILESVKRQPRKNLEGFGSVRFVKVK
ncbi:MAG: hypothetical protein ACRENP_24775 [Longimicrobiales bacterium]